MKRYAVFGGTGNEPDIPNFGMFQGSVEETTDPLPLAKVAALANGNWWFSIIDTHDAAQRWHGDNHSVEERATSFYIRR